MHDAATMEIYPVKVVTNKHVPISNHFEQQSRLPVIGSGSVHHLHLGQLIETNFLSVCFGRMNLRYIDTRGVVEESRNKS